LEAIQPERLELYGEHIRSLLTAYGPDCWFLIYQADIRMRSEQFERLRRKLQIDFDDGHPSHGFVPTKPWDAVFAAAVKDKEFWDSEVREKAILYLAKVTNFREVTHDGTAQQSRSQPSHPQTASRSQKRKSGTQGFRQEPSSKGPRPQSKGKGKGYGSNNQEPCNRWNDTSCNDPCPNGRMHVCSSCRGNHKVAQCNKNAKGSKKGGKGKRK
jgi:hypothetical protein